MVRTPSGGAHAWFRSTGTIRNSASKIAPGVDTRGDGGYVIAPPSMNGVAAYRFERGGLDNLKSLPEFPADLRDRIEVKPQPVIRREIPANTIAEASLAAAAELTTACAEMAESKEGSRNADLNRLAFLMGQLVGSGRLTDETVEERLGAAASEAGLGDGEINVTIASGLAAGRKAPRFPTIFVAQGKIAQIIDFAEAELIAARLPIFQRAGQLVTPAVFHYPARRRRSQDRRRPPQLDGRQQRRLRPQQVRRRVQEVRRAEESVLPDRPTVLRCERPGQQGAVEFPEKIAGVVTTPTMRPDGSILDQPGYDPATQFLLVPDQNVEVPTIKAKPTKEDARRTLQAAQGFASRLSVRVGNGQGRGYRGSDNAGAARGLRRRADVLDHRS